MTPAERKLMAFLCKLIAQEKDPGTFDRLVAELNELLAVKYARIHLEHKTER